MRQWNTIKGD